MNASAEELATHAKPGGRDMRRDEVDAMWNDR
ncbi:hypothetical protein EV132_102468 [Rhizobium sullae]|uniref:Uncharacterized protein n=1 Tax=Rhizobium sullae TaxID=50338 RepID=A0A4R3QEP3_RHISU|nr:hypothetical protein EV132_102468 [Rhizobium sullae]